MKNNWNQITLRDYKKLNDLLHSDWDSDLSMNLALVSELNNVVAEDLEVNVLEEYMKSLNFMMTPYKPKTPEKEYIIKDRKYSIFFNVNRMTASQYIDFQNFYKDYDNKTANLAACFIIPAGKKYGEDYDPLEEAEFLYDNLTIDIFSDVMFFFVKLLRTSTQASLISSEKEMKKKLKTEKDPIERKKILRSLIQTRRLHLLLKNEIE